MLYTYFKRPSKYVLSIKGVFIICRLLYCAPMQIRSFASSFLCVFVLLRFVFFYGFFFVFVFMPLCSLNYASSFSEICAFILGNMRLRSSARNENDVNLAVASTVYRFCKEGGGKQTGKKIPLYLFKGLTIPQLAIMCVAV